LYAYAFRPVKSFYKHVYMHVKIINITFIVINYKRTTMILIHFDKARSLAKNAFNIKYVKHRAICLI